MSTPADHDARHHFTQAKWALINAITNNEGAICVEKRFQDLTNQWLAVRHNHARSSTVVDGRAPKKEGEPQAWMNDLAVEYTHAKREKTKYILTLNTEYDEMVKEKQDSPRSAAPPPQPASTGTNKQSFVSPKPTLSSVKQRVQKITNDLSNKGFIESNSNGLARRPSFAKEAKPIVTPRMENNRTVFWSPTDGVDIVSHDGYDDIATMKPSYVNSSPRSMPPNPELPPPLSQESANMSVDFRSHTPSLTPGVPVPGSGVDHFRRCRDIEEYNFINAVEDLSEILCGDADNITISYVRAQHEKIQRTFENWREAQNNYISLLNVYEANLELDWTKVIQSLYSHTNTKIANYLDAINSGVPLPWLFFKEKKESLSWLDRNRLPTFAGDMNAYPRFKNVFTKDVLPSLASKESSGYVLKCCLRGDARDLVEGTNDVDLMWQRLDQKYGLWGMVVKDYSRSLQDLSEKRGHSKSAFDLSDRRNDHVRFTTSADDFNTIAASKKKTRPLSMYDSRGNILEPHYQHFSPGPQRRFVVKSRDFNDRQRGSTSDLLYGDVTRINNLKVRYPIFDR